jgi:hypothetical protein
VIREANLTGAAAAAAATAAEERGDEGLMEEDERGTVGDMGMSGGHLVCKERQWEWMYWQERKVKKQGVGGAKGKASGVVA